MTYRIDESHNPANHKFRTPWSEDELLNGLRYLVAKYGNQAKSSSWLKENGFSGFQCAARKKFGSWNKFLAAAGFELTVNKYKGWSENQFIEEHQKLVAKHGDQAKSSQWLIKNGLSCFQFAAKKKFGYWNDFLTTAGFEVTKDKYKGWSEKQFIEEFKKIIAKHGDQAKSSKWLQKNGFNGFQQATAKKFGSWKKFLIAAGFETTINRYKGWSEQQFIEEFKKLVAEHGEEAKSSGWLLKNGFSGFHDAAKRKFGSWSAFRKASDASYVNPLEKPKLERKQIIELLLDLKSSGVIHSMTQREFALLANAAGFDSFESQDAIRIAKKMAGGSLLPADFLDAYEENLEQLQKDSPNAQPDEDGFSEKVDFDKVLDSADEKAERRLTKIASQGSAARSSEPEEQDLELLLLKPTAGEALRRLGSKAFSRVTAEESVEALIASVLDEIWRHAYRNELEALDQVHQMTSDNRWVNTVKSSFLARYKQAKRAPIPKRFRSLDKTPTLMQRAVMARAVSDRRLIIGSTMGTGKTLASQLAVMSGGAQRILVVCPNSIVEQWKTSFEQDWRGVEVITRQAKPSFKSARNPQVMVMNFEKFSFLSDEEIRQMGLTLKIDAIILDEVHYAKQRSESVESLRRKRLLRLIKVAAIKNDRLMILGMSGTPVINNLTEGVKLLLELVQGQERPDLETETTLENCIAIFREMIVHGIRQMDTNLEPKIFKTEIIDSPELGETLQIMRSKNASSSTINAYLASLKFDRIVELAQEDPCVIATQHVTGVVAPLKAKLEEAGLTVSVFTGSSKEANDPRYTDAIAEFIDGATDVLLGSVSCIGTGIDGLQHRSNRLIYADLPWTYANKSQLEARQHRRGMIRPLEVINLQLHTSYSTVDKVNQPYSYCLNRMKSLEAKRMLSDAAVDGVFDPSVELTPAGAMRDLDKVLMSLQPQREFAAA